MMSDLKFVHYRDEDYESVCDFLIALNQEKKDHINWNWARFEWMMAHPEFDQNSKDTIVLFKDGDKTVAAAIYDMYFGEGFLAALDGYEALYPKLFEYACEHLSDDSGFAFAISDDDMCLKDAALRYGFSQIDQQEIVMEKTLNLSEPVSLPQGLHFSSLDPKEEPVAFQWLLWQGFDHGVDRAVFENEDPIVPQIRPHLSPFLSVVVRNEKHEPVSYCCLWHNDKTDYVYVEPVCTIPSYRGKSVGKAVVLEALNRSISLGAKRAYVISDSAFYQKLGFSVTKRFSFYQKK